MIEKGTHTVLGQSRDIFRGGTVKKKTPRRMTWHPDGLAGTPWAELEYWGMGGRKVGGGGRSPVTVTLCHPPHPLTHTLIAPSISSHKMLTFGPSSV